MPEYLLPPDFLPEEVFFPVPGILGVFAFLVEAEEAFLAALASFLAAARARLSAPACPPDCFTFFPEEDAAAEGGLGVFCFFPVVGEPGGLGGFSVFFLPNQEVFFFFDAAAAASGEPGGFGALSFLLFLPPMPPTASLLPPKL
jgi:hypothetical protein